MLLIMPLERVYRHAYPCGELAIAYHIEGEDAITIDAVGPQYPDA